MSASDPKRTFLDGLNRATVEAIDTSARFRLHRSIRFHVRFRSKMDSENEKDLL